MPDGRWKNPLHNGPVLDSEGGTMMRPIEWHEECLKNVKAGLENKKRALEQLKRDIELYEKDIELREHQIASTKAIGKTSFDPDKFRVKK